MATLALDPTHGGGEMVLAVAAAALATALVVVLAAAALATALVVVLAAAAKMGPRAAACLLAKILELPASTTSLLHTKTLLPMEC
jgi:hypothetical protein